MKNRLFRFSAFNVLIWTATLSIIVVSCIGAYMVFGDIKVLRNWHMSVGGTNKTFHPGDALFFTSTSEKLVNTEGRADRYLVCDSTANDGEREIAVSQVPLNRPAGYNPERQNALAIPDKDTFISLPRRCQLVINACYTLYGFRTICQSASTEKFIVDEKAVSSSVPADDGISLESNAPEGNSDTTANTYNTEPSQPVQQPAAQAPIETQPAGNSANGIDGGDEANKPTVLRQIPLVNELLNLISL